MIDVSSEDTKALRSVLHIDLGLVFRILSHLQFVQRDCALVVKQLGSLQLRTRELLVGNSLSIIRTSSGRVSAFDAQQELAFFYRIAETRMNLYNAARSNRDNRHSPEDVRTYCTGRNQLGLSNMPDRSGQWELLGMVHLHDTHILLVLNLSTLFIKYSYV